MSKVVLSNVIETIESGSRPKGGKRDSGIPSIGAGELNDNGGFTFTKLGYVPEKYFKDLKRGVIKEFDVIVVKDGATTGKTSYVDSNFPFNLSAVNEHVFILRGIKEKILPKYLFYFLYSPIGFDSIMTDFRGATVGGISQKFIDKIEIPLPSLEEQKAIVAKLDRAQRLIDIDKAMLEKYDQLIQSVFLDMFGDPKTNSKKIKVGKLGDFAFINMGQSPRGSSYNENGEGEPLLNGPTEFGEKYPQEKQWTTEPKKFAEVDDILFCVRGATAGRTNLSDKKYCIGRGLAAIRGEDKLDTTFIHFVLKSHYDYFQNQGQGSTFINIAKKDLSNLEVPIPTKELQYEFISASKLIENQKQVTKVSLKKSEELFSSLVQEVFE